MVTRRDWLRTATARLTAAGCEDAAFDARCLLEDLGGMPRGQAADDTPLTEAQDAALATALEQRAAGRPLQYILGQWEFLTLTLTVGEGVLIPRPDTELLCEATAQRLKGVFAPRVLDLCAGSGCVGLGVASLTPTAQVTAVELSDAAYGYLEQNVCRYPAYAVTPRRADVLRDYADFAGPYDAIVSNPPYIPTADLAGLQREVRQEPTMALDGAEDGLLFYRTFAEHWCDKLTSDGFMAVEVGVGQAADVAALFAASGLENTEILTDMGGVQRVVIARK
ncbi:MAG: peptide chain release factor N(5)-glutamine methyltransferase [Clostridia bacterium]|nr:peptide chain release factor N(5)-glutamine methyltransferase [Clostridia bacterium]